MSQNLSLVKINFSCFSQEQMTFYYYAQNFYVLKIRLNLFETSNPVSDFEILLSYSSENLFQTQNFQIPKFNLRLQVNSKEFSNSEVPNKRAGRLCSVFSLKIVLI